MADLSKKYGASTPTEKPAWLQQPGGVEFSRRNSPDLYSNRLAVKQENIREWIRMLEEAKDINPYLKQRYMAVLVAETGQDGLYAALDPAEKASKESASTVEVIKARMACRPWDAYHPLITTIESMRQQHMVEYTSRARRNDRHNERLIQAELQTTQKVVSENVNRDVAPQKGFLGFLRR